MSSHSLGGHDQNQAAAGTSDKPHLQKVQQPVLPVIVTRKRVLIDRSEECLLPWHVSTTNFPPKSHVMLLWCALSADLTQVWDWDPETDTKGFWTEWGGLHVAPHLGCGPLEVVGQQGAQTGTRSVDKTHHNNFSDSFEEKCRKWAVKTCQGKRHSSDLTIRDFFFPEKTV